MVRLHALELLVGVRKRVAPVSLDEVLSEAEAAAMSAFRVVYDLSAPGFYHAGKHIRILGTAYTLGRKHLGIMAADMLHYLERLSRMDIDEPVSGHGGYLVAVVIDEVAGMNNESGLGEFKLAGFPEDVGYLGRKLRKLAPCLKSFTIKTERRDA